MVTTIYLKWWDFWRTCSHSHLSNALLLKVHQTPVFDSSRKSSGSHLAKVCMAESSLGSPLSTSLGSTVCYSTGVQCKVPAAHSFCWSPDHYFRSSVTVLSSTCGWLNCPNPTGKSNTAKDLPMFGSRPKRGLLLFAMSPFWFVVVLTIDHLNQCHIMLVC